MDGKKWGKLDMDTVKAAAKQLAHNLAPTDPDWATDLVGSLVKAWMQDADDISSNIGWAKSGDDDDKTIAAIEAGFFPEDPVTVTETSVSLPKDKVDDTSLEVTDDEALSDSEDDILSKIINAKNDEDLQAALDLGEPSDNLAGETTPEEDEMLKQAEEKLAETKSDDFSDTDKTSAEEAAEKPEEKKEEKPAESEPEKKEEDKPAEKKEEPKEEKPKETSKDEFDDTMKNITSALSDRF